MRPRLTTCCIAAALLALAGCGSDGDSAGGSSDDAGSSTEAIVAALVAQGAPQADAECVAEQLDGVTADELTEFFEAVDAGEEIVATEGVAMQFINAKAYCDATG